VQSEAEPAAFEGDVPILMYHAVADAPIGTEFPELFVPPDDLRGQLQWLQRNGYRGVTLDRVYRAWHEGAPMPRNPIVISFDDGLQSQFTEALPAMKEIGWPAVLNLKLDSLSQGELTNAMVERMIDARWEIDSHTFTHADVSKLEGESLKREISDSRKALKQEFGVPVDFFCYPGGRFDHDAIEAVRRAGYLGATTTKLGLAAPDRPYKMRRIRVQGSGGVEGMVEEMRRAETKSA
jgi:peptidoglycan/xylan/chitin deacetylase (PgdA/CDA1 family)